MSLFARLSGRVSGRDGRAWAGSVEDLLFDGETVERRVELGGDDRVVVTSHRLLAFTPGSGGENYRGVDLPNVADVRAGHEGERNLLGIGGRTAVYGAVLLAVGVFVDFGAFVPTDAFQQTGVSGQLGMGGLLAMLQQFLGVIARIDEFARLIGAVLVLFAVFVFGVYLLTRDRVLVVDVAGDDGDIRVPAEDDALDAAVADLEVVLFGSDASVGRWGRDGGRRGGRDQCRRGFRPRRRLGPAGSQVRCRPERRDHRRGGVDSERVRRVGVRGGRPRRPRDQRDGLLRDGRRGGRGSGRRRRFGG
ncbi:hypothetical protein ACFQL4_01335 [Halosimplex aquaticum]